MEEINYSDVFKCMFLETEDEDVFYVSFSFGSGYGDRLVAENEDMHWVGSGSSNILINIKKDRIKSSLPDSEVTSLVTMDTANLGVKIKTSVFKEVIDQLINIMFFEEISENEFEFQKKKSRKNFNQHIKYTEFLSFMEIQEYASPNRLYKVPLIQNDLAEVQYEDLLMLDRSLFSIVNTVTVISGSVNHSGIKEWLGKRGYSPKNRRNTISHVYRDQNYRMEDNRLVKNKFDDNRSIGTLVFRNAPMRFSMEEEEVCLQIIGNMVVGGEYSVDVTRDAASIIYEKDESTHVKSKLLSTIWNESKFVKARKKVNDQLNDLKKNDAEQFSLVLGQYAIQNKNMLKIMELTENLSLERFQTYIQQVRENMVETKIIYSTGG